MNYGPQCRDIVKPPFCLQSFVWRIICWTNQTIDTDDSPSKRSTGPLYGILDVLYITVTTSITNSTIVAQSSRRRTSYEIILNKIKLTQWDVTWVTDRTTQFGLEVIFYAFWNFRRKRKKCWHSCDLYVFLIYSNPRWLSYSNNSVLIQSLISA